MQSIDLRKHKNFWGSTIYFDKDLYRKGLFGIHGRWGNEYYQDRNGNIKFTQKKLSIGDKIISKLSSGLAGELEIIELKFMSNPSDRYFGLVKLIGYLH